MAPRHRQPTYRQSSNALSSLPGLLRLECSKDCLAPAFDKRLLKGLESVHPYYTASVVRKWVSVRPYISR